MDRYNLREGSQGISTRIELELKNHKKLFNIVSDRFDAILSPDERADWRSRLADNSRWEKARDEWRSCLCSLGAELVEVGDLDFSQLIIGDHCYIGPEKIYLSDPSTTSGSDVNLIAMDSELALKILALGMP